MTGGVIHEGDKVMHASLSWARCRKILFFSYQRCYFFGRLKDGLHERKKDRYFPTFCGLTKARAKIVRVSCKRKSSPYIRSHVPLTKLERANQFQVYMDGDGFLF
jgi:hypothetical protein